MLTVAQLQTASLCIAKPLALVRCLHCMRAQVFNPKASVPSQLRGVFYVAALASGILESTVALERDVAEALGRKSRRRPRDRRLGPRQHASEPVVPCMM